MLVGFSEDKCLSHFLKVIDIPKALYRLFLGTISGQKTHSEGEYFHIHAHRLLRCMSLYHRISACDCVKY